MNELNTEILYPFPEETRVTPSRFLQAHQLEERQTRGDIAQHLIDGGRVVVPLWKAYGIASFPFDKKSLDSLIESFKKHTSLNEDIVLLVSSTDELSRWAMLTPELHQTIMKSWAQEPSKRFRLDPSATCPFPWQSTTDRKVTFMSSCCEPMRLLVEAVGGVLAVLPVVPRGDNNEVTIHHIYRLFTEDAAYYIDQGPVPDSIEHNELKSILSDTKKIK